MKETEPPLPVLLSLSSSSSSSSSSNWIMINSRGKMKANGIYILIRIAVDSLAQDKRH